MEPGETPASFPEFPVNNVRENIMENVRTNAKRELPFLQQSGFTETPLLVVGGGPSLNKYLDTLIRLNEAGAHILAINGAYKFLVGKGLRPEHFFLIDSREGNAVHVEFPLSKTNHILASQVHPKVFDRLAGYPVTMIHLGTEATMEALPGVKGPFLTAPIGFAGIHAVYAATALGYKHQFLFGYDFSFEDSHHAFPQPLNDNDESIEVTITEGGKVYRTTDAMAHAANHFRMAITPLIQTCDIDIRMMSDGLLPDIIHQCQDTLESEQKKYEEIWQKPVYSEKSPAMEWVEEAVDLLGVEYGDSISDFGCGTGRSVRWMIDQGFDAVGVDITPAGLDQEIPFVQAALWESDKLPQTKYGFSTDVMEHIPRDKIRETLRAIHDSCSVGCYLNIDTLPDHLGQLIGKPLHLTVMEYSKWEALLKEFWPNVSGRPEGRQAIFVCRR